VKRIHLIISFAFLVSLIFFGLNSEKTREFFASFRNMTASVFFVDSLTENDLLAHYETARTGKKPVKIIIVPGHDDTLSGAVYRKRREADMNMELGKKLAKFLSADSEFEVLLTRTDDGYNPVFWDYRERGADTLYDFVKSKKLDMQNLLSAGSVHQYEGVKHNKAPKDAITTLYSINRWANETMADIVIHIHFNDAAERKHEAPYDYSGFSIYIPEKQFSNARVSRALAKPIFDRLSKFYPVSDLPKENSGLVESQDLIAIGAYNTLDSAGMLIEYSYIYEPQFEDGEVREKTITEMAWQTYLGLNDFFKTKKSKNLAGTIALESLNEQFEKGSKNKSSVLDLQKALLLLNTYPPKNKSLRECPLTGNFGQCTETALNYFQSGENILGEEGLVGEKTLNILHKKLELLHL
jgi:N-acetylmuramoyl-L-alanine amidase